MKQTHKKILGILSLVVVVAVTVFAASLPAPETQATASVTDEITVRVVGEEAGVRINEIGTRSDTSKELSINIDYEKIADLTVDMSYFDGSNTHNIQLAKIPSSYSTVSSLQMSFNFENKTYSYNGGTYSLPSNFGYGEYSIHAYGYGSTEVNTLAEDYFNFKYTAQGIVVPNTGTVTEQKTNLMQTDYLITGLIIFLLVGISGFMFISGREKNTRKRRK